MSIGLFKDDMLNEGRSQIKRKYGEYSSIRVNEKAPVRNEIVRFVGKRFVTNEEMTNFLNKLSEDRGKEVNSAQWFKRNQKYFEKFENRGQSVWTLSKYGKRVYEFIIKADSKGAVNESEDINENRAQKMKITKWLEKNGRDYDGESPDVDKYYYEDPAIGTDLAITVRDGFVEIDWEDGNEPDTFSYKDFMKDFM
jgi:hypothetical protein